MNFNAESSTLSCNLRGEAGGCPKRSQLLPLCDRYGHDENGTSADELGIGRDLGSGIPDPMIPIRETASLCLCLVV